MSRKKKRKKQKISSVRRKSTKKTMPSYGSLFEVDGELRKAIQYHQSGNVKKAERIYKKILKVNRDHPVCLNLLGIIAGEAGNTDMAVHLFSEAIQNDPRNPVYHTNLANALKDQGKLNEAISCCQKALELKPDLAEAYNNMGIALAGQGRLEEAMACYEKAVELRLDYAEAYYNMGSVFQSQGKLSEAILCCQKALELKPDCAEAYYNMGAAFHEWGRPDDAISCYRKSLQLDPDLAEPLGQLIDQLQQTCAWDDIEILTAELNRFTEEARMKGVRTPETPFLSLMRGRSLPHSFAIAESWSSDIAKSVSNLNIRFSFNDRQSHRARITVGYLSNDFRYHPVAHHMLGLFGLHNRDKYKIYCYSYGKDDASYCRKRIQQDCDKFVDLRTLDYVKAGERIYEDRVDILVDLTGLTRGNRSQLCALRPAPIQVSYLGFLGTTGADFLDYIITDRIVTPEEHAGFYSEKFVFMPHCFMVNNNAQPISNRSWKKTDFGLPEGSLVFCSFNAPYKIDAVMFDVWMKILKQVPNGVLWLQLANQMSERNLRQEAETRGVNQERLVFSEILPLEEHLSRLRLADLALDTRIYNGGATTNNALWVGVPVITLQGDHFVSRMSSSSLKAIGLPELVTQSLEEYEALAVRLAHNPDELRAIREKLARNRLREPLFDTSRFVSNLEKAYDEMWKIFQAGDRPRQIEIAET